MRQKFVNISVDGFVYVRLKIRYPQFKWIIIIIVVLITTTVWCTYPICRHTPMYRGHRTCWGSEHVLWSKQSNTTEPSCSSAGFQFPDVTPHHPCQTMTRSWTHGDSRTLEMMLGRNVTMVDWKPMDCSMLSWYILIQVWRQRSQDVDWIWCVFFGWEVRYKLW